jgi:hypothetical protein
MVSGVIQKDMEKPCAGYRVSIIVINRIVLRASTDKTPFMMVWPVSRSMTP